jgi:hypothetical protein
MARTGPFAILTLALTLIATTAWAAPRVAVMPVDFEGRVTEVSRVTLNERLVEALARAGFEVSAGDVLKNAVPNGTAPESCHTASCYKQVAAKLALEFLVVAQVKIRERNYALKLQLLGRDGKPSSDERETCELCGIQEVSDKLDKLASSLMSRVSPGGAAAKLTVQSEPTGATVTVDGRTAGETPLSIDLPSGTHQLALVASGHADAFKKVTLDPGVRGLVSVNLLPLEHHPTGLIKARRPLRELGFLSMGAGLAAIGTGALLLARYDHQPIYCTGATSIPAPREPGPHCYSNVRLPAGLLLGGGAVALASGGLLLFVDWSPAIPTESLQARQWMVSAGGTF